MSIVFACGCGSTLKAKEADAGKRTKCPKCGKVVPIPGGAPRVEAVAAGISGGDPDAIAVDTTWHMPENGPHRETGSSSETSAAVAADRSITIDASVADREELDPLDSNRPAEGTLQYKVLTPKEYTLPGKFNPGKLEEALNGLAQKGWSVKSSVVVHVHSHSGAHDELIVILER